MDPMPKRQYNRRSDEERIAEYQRQIEDLRARAERKAREDDHLLKGYTKLQAALRSFIQLAHDRGRGDIGNTVQAFAAGLQRQVSMPIEEPRRRRGASNEEL